MGGGTLRKFSLDGNPFDLIGDSDIDRKPEIMVELTPTTGDPMPKRVKQIAETTGFKVVYTKANYDLISQMIGSPIQCNYTDADGQEYFCKGYANITGTSTSNGEIQISVSPTINWV